MPSESTYSVEQALQLARVGTLQADEASRQFTAGDLSVQFQAGALRYLRYRGQELVRAISFLVRDENWGTFAASLADLQVEQDDAHFSLSFSARCGPHGDDLLMQASITGRADGSLDFEVTAHVQQALLTNRTGFVVLHPLEVSGLPVEVEQVDGSRVQARFPEQIDPVQPFKDIRALATQHGDGLRATVRMEGDTFEMEDQRNWSDASFKTYVRPLALPWPYTLDAGTVLRQAVRVSVILDDASSAGQAAASRPAAGAAIVRIENTPGSVPAPRLAIAIRASELAASLAQAAHLKALGLACFIARLDLREDDLAASLEGFAQLSKQAGIGYTLELVLRNDPSRDAVMAQLGAVAAHLRRMPQAIQLSSAADLKAVLPGSPWPPSPSFETMLSCAHHLWPGIPLGAGSQAYFTELNRKRPPAAQLDYLSFTTCPIVHAADDRSVMETLSTLPYIARSAQSLYPGQPWHVGPSSIAARDNPYGSSTAPNVIGNDAGRICLSDDDPRQRALFGAAWNLGYFAQFAAQGASQLALSELTGPRGLLHQGQPTPLYHLLASLAQAADGRQLRYTINADADGHRPYVLALRHHDELLLWAANPTAQPMVLDLRLPGDSSLDLRRWDEHALRQAPQWQPHDDSRVVLQPYETVQLRRAMPDDDDGAQP